MNRAYDIAGFRRRIGAIRSEDNPVLVKQKSRDFYWYSPVLKRELDAVTADIVVSPTTRPKSARFSRRPIELGIPVTPRGSGTGNYGQAMPLTGGVLLNLAEMNRVLSIHPGRVDLRARRDPRRRRQGDGGERSGASDVSLDARDRFRRRLRRRRLRRGRFDHVGRLARFRQRAAAARPDDGGEPARARTDRGRPPQGRARLWHQRDHHRSRNAVDRGL